MLVLYGIETAIKNKMLNLTQVNRYRHCEVRSNLVSHRGLSVKEIASYLAMTGVDLRVKSALVSESTILKANNEYTTQQQ